MMDLINGSQEFYEVLNEFPVIKGKLKALRVDVKDLQEGQSIEEYFRMKSYSADEIDLLIRKFNSEVKQLLKKGEVNLPQVEQIAEIAEEEE